jgi:hypothetical protein
MNDDYTINQLDDYHIVIENEMLFYEFQSKVRIDVKCTNFFDFIFQTVFLGGVVI